MVTSTVRPLLISFPRKVETQERSHQRVVGSHSHGVAVDGLRQQLFLPTQVEPLLLATLARIILVPWQWEAQEEGHKCFIVSFPSKDELTCMVAIKTITIRNKEGTFSTEEYVDDVQPIKVPDQVWVTVTKVPRALRSFLPLWVVGAMIGATQKVDVYHLRRTG
jgi:hypothetical protein